ncbi:hypothetical protein GTU73_11195 [Rathayibacter sp. VKM Ac-2804]|uniref:hypothetical protein n=1 Tax=Rathayibacter sp. VKM Ac-2804 TaxID=2609257 RepID=UPI00132ED894|nr:hypothetical protein [Rathayibacter sp. VKM Ac-2804]QHF24517.1 hypothetical protein GTU73_11195 [Rathayibacter sp. VKM Ac-2804]
MQTNSLRTAAVIAGAGTLLALVAGLALDGFDVRCNESAPPQCTGFHVVWPALLPVALATLLLVFVTMRLSALSGSRWAWILTAAALVGSITSWVLALRTALVIG